jgi:hypothetical protein
MSRQPIQSVDIFRFHNKVELHHELEGYLMNLVPGSPPLIIVAEDPEKIETMRSVTTGHRYAVGRRHRLTIEELMNPNHEFKGNDAGRYMFVDPAVINSLNVSGCQILCYEPPLIPAIAILEPTSFIFFLMKNEFLRIKSMVPGRFSSHINFQQHPAFRASYNRDEFCMLNELSQPLGDFLFPDMREFDAGLAERIRRWAELPPCKDCGTILLRDMPVGFCCKPFGHKIISNLFLRWKKSDGSVCLKSWRQIETWRRN